MKGARPFRLAGLIILTLLLAGCAAPRVHLSVTGYANPGYSSGPAGGSFFVLLNENAANTLFDREAARKLERVMTDLGFVSAPREEAGFFLAYSFGLEQGPLVTRYQPYYEPGESYSHFKGYDEKGRPIYVVHHRPGFTYYQPYQEQTQRRWLEVRILDADTMRREGRKEVIWAGDAESLGSSRDLRSVLNFLILGVSKQLWVDTGRALEYHLPQDDPGAARIGGY